MKLYTKGGDDGTTGLFGGTRVPKHHARVATYGDVDEINAALGVAITACDDAESAKGLATLQCDLFVLGAQLATPDGKPPAMTIGAEPITRIEEWIDAITAEVPELERFILPGGTPAAAALHLARTVCRRAERSLASLSAVESVAPEALIYLNRLGDLLFALARLVNHRAGVSDIAWSGHES